MVFALCPYHLNRSVTAGTAKHVILGHLCTRTAKTHAILSLHRDSFVAKVPGLCPDASSSNAYIIIPSGR